MKGKIVFLSKILVFGLGGYGTANAEESENLIQLTPEEITEFQEYGFHEGQLVEGLTQELYETYKGAEVEAFDKVIYEYIEDNDGSVEYEVVTEEVYESRSAENEFGLLNETEDSGWIILELTVSNVGGGERMVQNSFTFQGHSPSSTFRDAVGISHDHNSQNRSAGTSFWYQTDASGSGTYEFQENTNTGIGIAFDLQNEPTGQNHRGSFSMPVVDSGAADKATVYGHYIHTNTPSWFENISIGFGTFSVSGVNSTSQATAPSATWDW